MIDKDILILIVAILISIPISFGIVALFTWIILSLIGIIFTWKYVLATWLGLTLIKLFMGGKE